MGRLRGDLIEACPPIRSGGSAPYGWLQHEDISKKLECFWESFERRGKEQKQLISLGTLDNNMPAVSLPTTGSVNDSSTRAEDCNYLDVDIAEIRCPESPGGKTSGDEGRDTEIQRMYYLGLVFYELFSGGSVPPTELYALAASDGAFVSLPTLTLAKSSDDEDTSRPAESKRGHCPGPSGREMGLCQLSFQYLEMMDLPRPICYLIFNMLDCIYGDLGGDECYSELADVLFDLQLMQKKQPNSCVILTWTNCLSRGCIWMRMLFKEMLSLNASRRVMAGEF